MAAPSFLPETETITKGYRINVSTAGEEKKKKKTPKHGKRLSAKRPFSLQPKYISLKGGSTHNSLRSTYICLFSWPENRLNCITLSRNGSARLPFILALKLAHLLILMSLRRSPFCTQVIEIRSAEHSALQPIQ